MVATAVLLLLHVPSGVASLSVVLRPAQTTAVPRMFVGNGFTVNAIVAIQPVAIVYVIVAEPTVLPVTRPVPDTIGATVVLLLLHAPNGVASFSAVVRPKHTVLEPPIAAGNGLTVTTAVLIQPVGKV